MMFSAGFIWLNYLLIILARITAANDNMRSIEKRSPDNRQRILGGSKTPIDEVPYQVSIRLVDVINVYGGHICGGSLISQRVVLTAAHCCYEEKKVKRPKKAFLLVMGNTHLDKYTSTEKEYRLAGLRVHNLYNLITTENDLALMFLDGVVPSSSLAQPIELNKRPVEVGTICRISGWGLMSGEVRPTELQSAQVVIMASDTCKPYFPNLVSSEICAGVATGEVDACKGDSGGPLVCKHVLVGVVSYGQACTDPSPGIYQSVAYFSDWIRQQNKTFDHSPHSKSAADALASFGRCWHRFALLPAFIGVAAY